MAVKKAAAGFAHINWSNYNIYDKYNLLYIMSLLVIPNRWINNNEGKILKNPRT